jgi:hypothetical protein
MKAFKSLLTLGLALPCAAITVSLAVRAKAQTFSKQGPSNLRQLAGDSRAGLERNRGRDLECVSLEGRPALEFTKILKPDVHLLLR